jgi:hypothetical protein
MKLTKLADRCWEGLTLEHVSQKEIVLPYMFFISLAIVFEVFLLVLSLITSFLFVSYSHTPGIGFMLNVVILIIMLYITVSILLRVRKKHILA